MSIFQIPTSKFHSGFALLATLVIISAAALIVAYSAIMLGLGELDLGYTSQKGAEALSIAEGCMEEALRRLRINPSLTGTLTPTVFNGSCSVSITAGSPIVVTSTGCTAASCASAYSKKIRVELTINTTNQINAITIGKWEEVSL